MFCTYSFNSYLLGIHTLTWMMVSKPHWASKPHMCLFRGRLTLFFYHQLSNPKGMVIGEMESSEHKKGEKERKENKTSRGMKGNGDRLQEHSSKDGIHLESQTTECYPSVFLLLLLQMFIEHPPDVTLSSKQGGDRSIKTNMSCPPGPHIPVRRERDTNVLANKYM